MSTREGAYGTPVFALRKMDIAKSEDLQRLMEDKFELKKEDWPVEFKIHVKPNKTVHFYAASPDVCPRIVKYFPF